MKVILITALLLFFFLPSYAANFGEYQYTKYLGIQQALQNQRNLAQKRNAKYNQSPTRNIRYPSAGNPYPNIADTNSSKRVLSARQRYSPVYYQKYY